MRILDNLESQTHRHGRPRWIPSEVEFVQADIRDRAAVAAALRDSEAVFHQAAYGGYMPEIAKYVGVNSFGTAQMLEIIREESLPIKKVVVASSQAVYSEGAALCAKHGLVFLGTRPVEQLSRGDYSVRCPRCGAPTTPTPTPEETPIRGETVYAITKVDQERLVLTWGRQIGIPSVALRYSCTYGPRQSLFNPYTGVIVIFCTRLLNRLPPALAARHGMAEVQPRTGRRAFIVAGLGAFAAFLLGDTLRRLYKIATFSYDGRAYEGPGVKPITPNAEFYCVTKNFVDPVINREIWRLEIGGEVERPRVYRFAELAALPAVTQETTLMCISQRVDGGWISNAVWKGIPLRNLIEAAGPKPGVVEVSFSCADGYNESFDIGKAMEPTTLLAYEMNGEPLPDIHGYPLRLLIPGYYGEKSGKWLTCIELVSTPIKGFYKKAGWGPNFVIPTLSRFQAPDFHQPLKLGTTVELRGTAFGGNRGISKVEVSLDDGQSWQDAKITYPGTRLTWSLWSYEWQPKEPADFELVVRATDGNGTLQTSEARGPAPQGATGLHRVTAHVLA